jgi:hypothetical protein
MDFNAVTINYIDDNANRIIFALLIVSIIFIMVGHIFQQKIQAMLKTPIVTIESFDLDYWSVSHFMLFAAIGFIKPDHAFTFFSLGVLFEILEDGLSSSKTTKIINCTKNSDKNSFIGSIMCSGYDDSYWYSKIDDIFINLLGYVTGQSIRKTFL